jgi:hypothetical protein
MPEQSNDYAKTEGGALPSPVAESAEASERALQREIGKRREERFFWIFGVVILVDFIALRGMSWIVGILLILMELILLVGLAKWLGIQWIAAPFDRLIEKYSSTTSKGAAPS